MCKALIVEQRMSKHTFNDTIQLIQRKKEKKAGADKRKKQTLLSDRPGFKSCLHCFVVATITLDPTVPLVKGKQYLPGRTAKGTCHDAQKLKNTAKETSKHRLSLQWDVLCSFNPKTELNHKFLQQLFFRP